MTSRRCGVTLNPSDAASYRCGMTFHRCDAAFHRCGVTLHRCGVTSETSGALLCRPGRGCLGAPASRRHKLKSFASGTLTPVPSPTRHSRPPGRGAPPPAPGKQAFPSSPLGGRRLEQGGGQEGGAAFGTTAPASGWSVPPSGWRAPPTRWTAAPGRCRALPGRWAAPPTR
jgi:hypothetical protein